MVKKGFNFGKVFFNNFGRAEVLRKLGELSDDFGERGFSWIFII